MIFLFFPEEITHEGSKKVLEQKMKQGKQGKELLKKFSEIIINIT